jgi:hypothetical protein
MSTADVLHAFRRASNPYGVATENRLELTPRQLLWACRNGVLDNPHRGVFVDKSTMDSPQRELAIAIAAGGPLAPAWARSAAAVWDMLPEHPSAPEIVVPYSRRPRIAGAVVHRSKDLCWDHVMWRQHLLVTKPVITALDLGVVLGPMDLAEVLVRARQLKLFEPEALRAAVARLAKPGRTGVTVARAGLELLMIGDRPADSVLELHFHHGPGRSVPPYQYQWPVQIRGQRLRIDFAYPEIKLAIEVEGYESRRSREALEHNARRSNLLTLDGWTIIRFTWTDVRFNPTRVASEILAALVTQNYTFCR